MRETSRQTHDSGDHVTVKHYLLTTKRIGHKSPEK